jgi:Mg2+-importing ATPase
LFAAALGVSVIPEALPVVITFCLTRGAALLAAHQVVVKRLSSIEDLGSMQILCTDKTGTLTENKMTVSQIYGDHEKVLWYATLGSGLTLEALGRAKGFDAAIFAALPAEKHQALNEYEKKNEIPFDPERRKSTVAYQGRQGIELVFRGAPEAIISFCTLAESEKKEIDQWMHEQGIQGKRILGIAHAHVSKIPASLDALETPAQFIGLVSFADPLKPTAQEAVQKAKELGLKIKILSGDTAQVCGAIGMQVGIIENPHQVMEGSAFELLSSEEKHTTVQEFQVFARVTPTQKYDIIKLLQEKYQVGFIGDGINDAPALRIAHVAIAVDDAADIALQSADIIVLHKSLRVIVDGISYGRMTFINTMKFLKTTLAGNLGNFYAIGIASLFIDYVPMLPTQLLLLNFLSDIPLIALSTDTVAEQEISTPQRYDMRDLALITIILGIVSTLFDLMIFAYFYRATPATLQTNWFIASVATELAFMFSIRTSKFMLRSSLPSFTLLFLAGLIATIALILPYSSFGHYYFHFVSPQPAHLIIIGVIVVLYLIATELIKLLYNRTAKC